jgi:hypothetical protein
LEFAGVQQPLVFWKDPGRIDQPNNPRYALAAVNAELLVIE